ncbi:cytochrome P450 [Streptomyces sp. E11-3]|uniref:cytochrome P450 n=1 Tax=Streptomyces sp. E11-3 TaxID=3110112 RepID=UPI00397FE3F3
MTGGQAVVPTPQESDAVEPAVAPGRLPVLGHAVQLWRRPIAFLESLRTVGGVVRIDLGTWPVYVLTSPDLVDAILVGEAQQFGRGRVFDKLRPLFGNGIVTTDGEFHRKQRRLMQPAFRRAQLTAYAEVMAQQADEMAASWTAGQELSIVTEMRGFTLSSVAKMIFSGDLGRPAVAEVQRSLPVILEGMLVRAVIPKALDRLPIPLNRRFDTAAARLRRIIDQVIVEYRAEQADRQDLLSLLLSSVDAETGETMSDEQVRDEVIAIMFAGTETSATVLTWIFHELGRHPEARKRVQAEVDDVIGDRPVRPDDVPRLTYTHHVFHEALRLHSPLLFTRRALAPVNLGGVAIPDGAELAYSLYALHRDPALFPEPQKFRPERWEGNPRRRPHLNSFIPFGAGQHKCIGDHFAAAEIVIAVASVMSRWDVVHAPGVTVREVPAGIPQPDHLPMIPHPRQR